MNTLPTISIQTTKLSKSYPKCMVQIPDIHICERITLIKGKNGSGKSTFLQALMGFVQYQGIITTTHTFSYMPEHTSFPKDVTVQEFLQTLHDDQGAIRSLLTQFHILNKKDNDINTLSKGMKAKLNCIQCLLQKADVYLLDEPFGGLDIDSVHILVDYIKQSSNCFVITSHIDGVALEGDVISFD